MYVFAIAALLGLGVFTLAMLANRYLSMAHELWTLVLVALGIGAAWFVDFDVFHLWGVDTRADWIGVTLTGLMVGGLGFVCRGLGHLAGEITRIVRDEADTIEKEKDLRRVA